MISSLLIANRGEIASRVIRTARKLGIRTIAVYSDADAKALHVRQADEAVHIGPSPARESYLRGDRIIEAAQQSGAEAIHPGYGFLSENADFAQAVIDAGLIWVGPKPDSIRAMGLKDAAKTLMAEAGVPVTPGYLGEDQSPERLKAEAHAIGYPVLIKAVAGGGGKGMRKVDAAADFDDALDSCRREAASSFGNDVVLLEKWIESPRHIEVQVFGDAHGNVVHLFERDCSLQRRHQKVIEEAPAPGMDEATREAVCGAAVRAAKAVNYEGAGTIEFIADASEGLRADRIWFMEMNTRLQVEHPVTEEITGQDLVEWQLRVASGEALPRRQDELAIEGHAMEARLYAEDPEKGFLPATGRIGRFDVMSSGWVRIDTGVERGDEVTPYYDPMVAKIIATGANREEARIALRDELDRVTTYPLRNNAAFLYRLADHPAFAKGGIDTGFIASHLKELTEARQPDQDIVDAAATAFAAAAVPANSIDAVYGGSSRAGFPWSSAVGFRINARPSLGTAVFERGRRYVGQLQSLHPALPHWPVDDGILAVRYGTAYYFTASAARGPTGGAISDGMIIAPMPGKVTSIECSTGEKVTKRQRLLTLEAMKMEHALTAPFDGTLEELNVAVGDQVQVDAVLARIAPAEPSAA